MHIVRCDSKTIAREIGEHISRVLVETVERDGIAHVVLTGGTLGIAVLGEIDYAAIDWSLVHLWWGDERFVSRDSVERNCNQAELPLLSRIAIPEDNIHRVASTDEVPDVQTASDKYAIELERFASPGRNSPRFCLTLLGMGPDAHVASLFPDRREGLNAALSSCAVVDSPKPPPERVSLTYLTINSSERVWLLVSDAGKAEALDAVLSATDDLSLPASCVRGSLETLVWADDETLALHDARN